MKYCAYCGKEYSDDIETCSIDGSTLRVIGDTQRDAPSMAELQASFRKKLNWSPRSAFGLVFASSIAAVLICTGLFCLIGRLLFDVLRFFHFISIESSSGREIYAMFMPPWLQTCLAVGIIILSILVCRARCGRGTPIIIAAIGAIGMMAFLWFVPGYWILAVPALFFASVTRSPLGLYFGSALQILAGAWLLGWFSQKKNQNEVWKPLDR